MEIAVERCSANSCFTANTLYGKCLRSIGGSSSCGLESPCAAFFASSSTLSFPFTPMTWDVSSITHNLFGALEARVDSGIRSGFPSPIDDNGCSGVVSIMSWAQWVGVLIFIAVLTIGSQWCPLISRFGGHVLFMTVFVRTPQQHLGPCQLNERRRRMEKMTWHVRVNASLPMCQVVHTAMTHTVIAIHNSAGEHITYRHRNARQPPPRHCVSTSRPIVTPADHRQVTALPLSFMGDDDAI
ncbi:uncharacterized protein LACBIDRAFT_327585 [Laccaria bicolor S238N-H82]|uniref:Predicted protein n=1 Tax=Laccaria bicolor (strain S238N-H82 / ATCC MYA-4686) TaxID=486041 RepID=B0DC73_LACBS|nr:uncharacterized protein LACBIDRAFT_327585 [Laccaria bicolor S238N-H82]EDR07682.1 predicted protein [Laccaria bicolor S238N-H82]|eukprot:XP_001881471.1 predicted protein [Laccaria bicolor S238N-H82]